MCYDILLGDTNIKQHIFTKNAILAFYREENKYKIRK